MTFRSALMIMKEAVATSSRRAVAKPAAADGRCRAAIDDLTGRNRRERDAHPDGGARHLSVTPGRTAPDVPYDAGDGARLP
jgi:hypothetical protein